MSTKQRLYLILGVAGAVAIGTALSWRPRPARPADAPQQAASSVLPVTVERTLVSAAVEVVERPARGNRARVKPRREAPPAAISRARRVLFGSGRYRPEPFPRVARQDLSAR